MPQELIFIPAYNEAASVSAVIEAIHLQLPSADALVIDDGPEDERFKP